MPRNIFWKEMARHSCFEHGDQTSFSLGHPFFVRWKVVFRWRQDLSGNLTVLHWQYVKLLCRKLCQIIRIAIQGVYSDVQPPMFADWYEIDDFFEAKPSSMVHRAHPNVIPVCCCRSSNSCLTALLVASSDEIKLSLFFIFNGEPNRHIEKIIDTIFPNEIYVYSQWKDWMDQIILDISLENVQDPHVADYKNFAPLLHECYVTNKKALSIPYVWLAHFLNLFLVGAPVF